MASTAKKGKKKKWVPLDLAIGDEPTKVVKTTNWGDEMEMQDDENDSTSRVVINLSALPTAPRSARGADVDLSRVPTVKPFTAFIGNLPFEVSQEDIERMFKDLKVEGVRLQTDQSGRMRGYGYVEFETREMLIDALSYNDASIKGRTVRVDLADNQHGQDRDRPDGGGFRSRDDGDDKTLGDWRKKDDRGSDKIADRERKDDFERGSDKMDRDRFERRDRYSSDRHDDKGSEQKRWGGAGSRNGSERFGHFGDRADRGHFDDRDRDRDFAGKSFGSGYRNRDEGERFGSRDFRGNDRPRDGENWGRNSDRYEREGDRRDGRFREGDKYREGERGDRPRDIDRGDRPRDIDRGDRFRDTDRGDRFRDGGDRYRDTADRGERYRNEERDRHTNEERDDDKAGDRFRDDRGRGQDDDRPREKLADEVRSRKHEEDVGKGRGRDHSREIERDVRSRDASKEIEKPGPKGRPRLNLQPRTKPLEEAGKMAAASASIFGGAKPVDTTQKLREIEEKQSKLRQKPEKDNRAGSEDDRPASISRQASSSDGPLSEEASAYKRQNSASKTRPKKDVSQDSEKRKDRPSTASGSSGKASNGSRKSSHTDMDDVSSVEADAALEKSAAVKMIPAPPPKENAWEKRKTIIAAQQQSAVVPANISADTINQPETVELKEEIPKEDTEATKVEMVQPSVASNSSPSCAETLDPQPISEGKLESVADAPKVNVWEMRKKQNEAKSQKPENPAAEASIPSQEVEVRKKAVVSVAGVGEVGGRGGSLVDRNDRRPGQAGRGEGGRGGGRGGMRRAEGGDIKRSEDRDSKRALPKKEKEKALPTSIEEMPKLEDKSKKDWSDRNKFSSLLMVEDDDDDDNKKGSDDEDNN